MMTGDPDEPVALCSALMDLGAKGNLAPDQMHELIMAVLVAGSLSATDPDVYRQIYEQAVELVLLPVVLAPVGPVQ